MRCWHLFFLAFFIPVLSQAQTITYPGTSNLCPSTTKILTASGAPGGSIYQWRKDGVNIPGATSSTYGATSTGSYDVIVTTASVPTTYTAIVLAAGLNPSVNFTFSPSGDCANSATTFTNTTTGNSPTYVWDFGDPASGSSANTSTATSPSRAFTGNPGNGTQDFIVKLTATDADGCVANKTQYVQKKQLPGTELGGTGLRTYDGSTYYAICNSVSGVFSFSNTSSTSATNTNYKIVWGNVNPDYNASAFGSILTQTYSTGAYSLTYTVTGGNGCVLSSDKYVFVGTNPSVGVPNPGSTQVCTGQSLTFPITQISGNTPGTKYKVDFHDGTTPVLFTDPTTTSITHTYNINSCGYTYSPFNNTFYVTIDAQNACDISSNIAVPIYVSQKPAADITISPSSNVCTNTTVPLSSNASIAKTATSSGCIAGISVWSITPATGFTIQSGTLGNDFGSSDPALWTAGSNNLSLNFTSPGTYSVKLRVGNNAVCGPDEITKIICVSATPTAAFSVDQNIGCSNLAVVTTNTSSAATCGTNTYSWTIGYSATSGCTPSTSNYTYTSGSSTSSNPQFNFINPGTYTIGLINTVTGGCTSPQVTKTITVKSKPVVTINASSSICVGNTNPTATVGTCSGTVSAYTWTLAGATPASASTLSPGTISYTTSGSYNIALDVTNECGVTSVSTPITVKTIPDVTVPANQIKCAGTTSGLLSFSGSLSGTTYTWTNNATGIGLGSSGSGSSISSFTLANSTASPIVSTISVVPNSGGCAGPSGTFSITVNSKPSAPVVSSPVNYCQNSIASQLTATAASGNTLMWYNNAGLTGGSATAPTPITAASGTTNYYVTQDNAFGCTSNSSTISAVVTAAVGNNTISADQTICSGSSASTLTGTSPTGGNGTGTFSYQWQSSLDGGITWSSASGTSTSSSYSPGIISVSTSYRRNVSSGACSQISSNTITIIVQPALSNTGIGSNQDICEGNPTALLTGQATTGGSGINVYQWESSLNNTSWTVITVATTQDYQPPVLPATTYYRRTVSSGSCSVSSSSVKLTVYNLPTAGTMSTSAVNTCLGSDVSLSTSGYIGTIKKWQYNFTPTNPATWVDLPSTGSIVSITNVQQNFSVRVIVMQDGSCPNEAIGPEIPVTVSTPTVAGTTGTDATVCTNANGASINLSGQTGSVLRWETSTNSGSTWATVANTTASINYLNLTASTWYRAIVQSGFCPQATSTITKIIVVPTVTSANAGVDQSFCALTTVTLNGNNPTVGTGAWSQVSGPAVSIVNPTLRNTQVNGLQPGQTYQFKWLITGPGTCPSSNDAVQIISTPVITQASAGTDILVCSFIGPIDSVSLNGNAVSNPAFETSSWSMLLPNPTGSNPQIRTVTNPASAFIFDKAGTYQLIHTISNGVCAATKDTVAVNVFDKPVVGPVTSSANTGCVGNSFTISSGNTLKGDILKWQYNFAYPNPNTWKDTLITNSSILFADMQQSFDVRLITVSKGIVFGCALSDTNRIPIEIIPDFTNVIDTTSLAICPGQSISIAGQLPSGAYNVFQYQWQQSTDGINGWTDITGQTFANLNLTPLKSIYLRRVVIVSPCSKLSSSAYVFVRPSVGNFLVSDSIGTCFPLDVTFTNLVLPSTLTTWNFGDGAFNQGDAVTHTYHSTGSFQVIMTAQYPGGCKFEATKNILITGPTGILKYDHQAICSGNPVYFEVASVGIDSVRWNFGDGSSQITTVKTIYHTYQQAGPYTPYIELLAGPGGACRSRINGPDTILVDQVKAGFKQAILQGCGITQVTYTDTSRAFYSVLSRKWDLGDGTNSTNINPSHQYSSERIWKIQEIVTGKSGCIDTANISLPLAVWDIPQIKTNKDSIACVGQVVQFIASVFSKDAVNSTVWTFSNGTGSTQLSAPKIYDFPGSYLAFFVASTIHNCSDTVRLPIIVYPKLQIDLGPDLVLPTGTLLPLNSTVTNGPVSIWTWSPDKDLTCNNCNLPIAAIKKDITYVVNAETQNGCKASDSISIKVFCQGAQVYIPNVFTPDGDGLNDLLMVRATGIRTVKSFRIFNRWGQVVFEKANFTPNEKSNGWDGMIGGKKANPDVYVYTCEVICENDVTYTYKGNITLVK